MSLLASVKTKITVESTRYRSAVSEFLVQTMGKTINWLIDRVDTFETSIEAQPFSQAVSTSVTLLLYPSSNYTVSPTSDFFFGTFKNTGASNYTVFFNGSSVFVLAPLETKTMTIGASTSVAASVNGAVTLDGVEFTNSFISIP